LKALPSKKQKAPRRFRPGHKKSHGPVKPAHGFGYSSLIVLRTADRRRDWHPGGSSSVMRHLPELHE